LYIQFLSINEIAFLLPLITLFSTYSYTLLTMIAFDIHFREFREKLDLNVKLNKLKMTKQYLNLSGLHWKCHTLLWKRTFFIVFLCPCYITWPSALFQKHNKKNPINLIHSSAI